MDVDAQPVKCHSDNQTVNPSAQCPPTSSPSMVTKTCDVAENCSHTVVKVTSCDVSLNVSSGDQVQNSATARNRASDVHSNMSPIASSRHIQCGVLQHSTSPDADSPSGTSMSRVVTSDAQKTAVHRRIISDVDSDLSNVVSSSTDRSAPQLAESSLHTAVCRQEIEVGIDETIVDDVLCKGDSLEQLAKSPQTSRDDPMVACVTSSSATERPSLFDVFATAQQISSSDVITDRVDAKETVASMSTPQRDVQSDVDAQTTQDDAVSASGDDEDNETIIYSCSDDSADDDAAYVFM